MSGHSVCRRQGRRHVSATHGAAECSPPRLGAALVWLLLTAACGDAERVRGAEPDTSVDTGIPSAPNLPATPGQVGEVDANSEVPDSPLAATAPGLTPSDPAAESPAAENPAAENPAAENPATSGDTGSNEPAPTADGSPEPEDAAPGLDVSPEVFLGASWPMPNTPGVELPNEQRYLLAGDGSVLDEVTGLQWQQAVDPTRFVTWSEAGAYCDELALAERDDWRLPTRIELVSVLSTHAQNPAIEASAFPDTPSDWFWSSTPSAEDPGQAWYVYFYFGYPGVDDVNARFSVRCVRRDASSVEAPAAGHTVTETTVTDHATGLTWQRGAPAGTFSFEAAQLYCAELELGGVSEWRAPSMKELETLVDASRFEPAIDPDLFGATPSASFWSSSPWVENPELRGWHVEFQRGTSLYLIGTEQLHVRCVYSERSSP